MPVCLRAAVKNNKTKKAARIRFIGLLPADGGLPQGLIDELDLMHLNGEGHYYERKLERDHIHMACLRCGKITEFLSDSFETLEQQVEKDCRFRVLVSRLEIRGYCAMYRGSR